VPGAGLPAAASGPPTATISEPRSARVQWPRHRHDMGSRCELLRGASARRLCPGRRPGRVAQAPRCPPAAAGCMPLAACIAARGRCPRGTWTRGTALAAWTAAAWTGNTPLPAWTAARHFWPGPRSAAGGRWRPSAWACRQLALELPLPAWTTARPGQARLHCRWEQSGGGNFNVSRLRAPSGRPVRKWREAGFSRLPQNSMDTAVDPFSTFCLPTASGLRLAVPRPPPVVCR